jgi:hypothetical protein
MPHALGRRITDFFLFSVFGKADGLNVNFDIGVSRVAQVPSPVCFLF